MIPGDLKLFIVRIHDMGLNPCSSWMQVASCSTRSNHPYNGTSTTQSSAAVLRWPPKPSPVLGGSILHRFVGPRLFTSKITGTIGGHEVWTASKESSLFFLSWKVSGVLLRIHDTSWGAIEVGAQDSAKKAAASAQKAAFAILQQGSESSADHPAFVRSRMAIISGARSCSMLFLHCLLFRQLLAPAGCHARWKRRCSHDLHWDCLRARYASACYVFACTYLRVCVKSHLLPWKKSSPARIAPFRRTRRDTVAPLFHNLGFHQGLSPCRFHLESGVILLPYCLADAAVLTTWSLHALSWFVQTRGRKSQHPMRGSDRDVPLLNCSHLRRAEWWRSSNSWPYSCLLVQIKLGESKPTFGVT